MPPELENTSENKQLLIERENVKRILSEREEDVRLLRLQFKKQKSRKKFGGHDATGTEYNSDSKDDAACIGQHHGVSKCNIGTNKCTPDSTASLVRQLELLQMRYNKLRHDLQVCKIGRHLNGFNLTKLLNTTFLLNKTLITLSHSSHCLMKKKIWCRNEILTNARSIG